MDYKITQVFPHFEKTEYQRVRESLDAAWVTEGPKCRAFTDEILRMTGSKHAVLAPNGTLSLFMALKVLGIKEGDEVLVPDFTMIASSNAVYLTGATPVFVDVSREDLNIDPILIEKHITSRTRAIMPVHIYGHAADMDAITAIAKKNKLFIVEDACQGVGLRYKGRHVGTFGNVGCFSFFADKIITTGGEGGMVITDDKDLFNELRYFRNQGRLSSGTFIHPRIGYNFRMTDLQCAVGVAQISKYDRILKKRLNNCRLYEQKLKGIRQIQIIKPKRYSNFVPFRFNIFAERLQELMAFLEKNKIQTRGMFYPLHQQPCYAKYSYNDGDFPNTIYAYEQGLSLPVYYDLKESDITYISKKIKEFYGAKTPGKQVGRV